MPIYQGSCRCCVRCETSISAINPLLISPRMVLVCGSIREFPPQDWPHLLRQDRRLHLSPSLRGQCSRSSPITGKHYPMKWYAIVTSYSASMSPPVTHKRHQVPLTPV